MNEMWGSVRNRLSTLLNKYSASQKRNMAVTVGFLIVAVVITVWAMSRPHYVTVMAGLDNKSLGQVQNELQTLGIPNEISGSSVLVPAAQANTARAQLAVAGIPQSGYIGYSQLANSPIGQTDAQFNLQVLNALQENLNQTIDTMNGIESAEVYIVEPQQALFVTQPTTGAKASVYVQVAPGAQLTPAQVSGIQNLVAHSVTGMQPSDVAVVNQDGVTLSGSDAIGAMSGTSNEIAMRQNLESSLQQAIANELNQIVGYGNAVVAVNENVTFNQVSTNSTRYTPASGQQTGLIASQQKATSTSSSPSAGGTSGVVGAASSNPGLPTYTGTTNTTGNSTSSTSNTITNYDNGKVTQTIVSDPMQINGIDVSVLLNSKVNALKSAATIKQIQQFVTGIVGKSTTSTNNSITVSAVPFANNSLLSGTSLSAAKTNIPLWAYAAGGVVLLGGGYLVLRRRRRPQEPDFSLPQPISVVADENLDFMRVTDDEKMRDELIRLAKQKPDEFASLLRTWLVSE